MYLAAAKTVATQSSLVQEFKGYNHNLRISENEFFDTMNMTSDYYPVLSPRTKRGWIYEFAKPNGFYANDKLIWVDGTNFYFDGNVEGTVEDSKKQFVCIGSYVCIFPDKKMYNTTTKEFTNMEQEKITSGTITYTLCKLDGSNYANYIASATEPDTATYTLWLDTSSNPNVLKQWSEAGSLWVAIPSTYVKISATGIGTEFAVYDAVTISGSTDTQFNTSMIIWAKGDDYIVVTALINTVLTQTTPLTLKREVPDMDFVTQQDNRIWGCSSSKHEIYACKLGDPTNWNCFMGLSSDSYAATVGSSGNFTGAFAHLGNVLFFKDNTIHKVYGNVPSNFQITDVNCRGVQNGSEKSLALVNETLFYMARDGVCAYDGNLPINISDNFGVVKYFDAVGGVLNDKYYISMRDADYNNYLFVYDSKRGMWLKEDNTKVLYFAYCDGGLYFIDDSNQMMVVNNEKILSKLFPGIAYPGTVYPSSNIDGVLENDFESEIITGDIGLSMPDNKYVSKIILRFSIEQGGELSIFVQYDSSGIWDEAITLSAATTRSYAVPIILNRCDHMSFKFSGTGNYKIYSYSKTIEEGSEI